MYEALNAAGDETLVVLDGTPRDADDWIISTWDRNDLMSWSAENVGQPGDGTIRLSLDAAESGPTPYEGAEIQSVASDSFGTWSWLAMAPELPDGAVFAMFTYTAEYQTQDWIEFDFEFVQGDTTSVQLNIHMLDSAGRHLMQSSMQADGPYTVDLGFDAAADFHLYEVTVYEGGADFLVDGAVVGRFGAADMPGGTWYSGPMNGFTSLWAAPPEIAGWAGEFSYPGAPIEAALAGIGTPSNPLQLAPSNPWEALLAELAAGDPDALGSAQDDRFITYTNLDQHTARFFDLGAGDDFVRAGTGADTLLGGDGVDQLRGGDGSDIIFGGAGCDSLRGDGGDDLIFVNSGDRVAGGAGADTLVFTEMLDQYVMIDSFNAAEGDRIDLSMLGLAADQVSLRQVRAWTCIEFSSGPGDVTQIDATQRGDALDLAQYIEDGTIIL